MKNLDSVIVEAYRQFNTPVDQIVADPEIATRFWKAVEQGHGGVLPPGGLADWNRKLMNMRKRGEDKGGLPRIRREYRGRDVNG
jgi:hypothetical protein